MKGTLMDRTFQPDEARRKGRHLEAMRHLPPSTSLPQPATVLEQGVLADLLTLPDQSDPLRWLCDERGAMTALLALRLLLEQARDVCQSARTRPPTWPPLPWAYHEVLGALLTPSVGDPGSDLLFDSTRASDPEQLCRTVGEMRQARGHPAADVVAAEDWLQLLAELLDLPDATDPLAWLADKHGLLCAHMALSHIMDQCLPVRDALWPGSRADLNLRPMARLHSSRGLRVVITQAIFTETGGALRLTVRLPVLRGWRRSPERTGVIPSWRGFDRVADDCGYQYLVWATEAHGGTGLLGWKQELTLALYPAIFPGATGLTFTARPMLVEAHCYNQATDQPITLPTREYGDLVWRLPLQSAARRGA